MAKKKSGINFKQILLQKGERYGLYVAGGLLLLFLFLGGFKALTSASTGTIVDKFKSGVQKVDQKMNQPGEQPKPIDATVYESSTVAQIPFTVLPVRNELFNIAVNEQTRRLNPRLYPPTDAQVDFVRGSISVFDIITNADGDRLIAVIRERPRTANDPNKIRQRNKKGGTGNPPPRSAPPPAAAGGGGMAGRPMGGPGAPGTNTQSMESSVQYKSINDKDIDQATFAQTIDPRRMVVVTASIPYRAQVEEYRRALRAKDKDNLSDYPEYRGFVVERRMLSLDGKKVEQDWTFLDLQTALGDLYSRVIEFEPESPPRNMKPELQALYPRVVPDESFELLVPRPRLYRGEYPPIDLAPINDALEKLAKSGQTATDIRTNTQRQMEDNNIFHREGAGGQQGNNGLAPGSRPGGPGGARIPPGMRTVPPPPGAPGGANNQPQRAEDEEAWIMRFIDVNAEAGHAYQYRVSLKALNPNYHKSAKELAMPSLAEKEMIQSDPYEIPKLVIVPPEEFLYAATNDDRGHKTERMPAPGLWDQTWVQMQRWYSYIRAQEFTRAEPFGEWLVADIRAVRGQYLGEIKPVTLPVWNMVKGMFLFRENLRRARPTSGVLVGERPKSEPSWLIELMPNPPIILVDFEGGTGQYVQPKNRPINDAAGVEMLFLTQDGKLRVARSGHDLNDADRVKREDGWKEWLQKVNADTLADKNRGDGPGPGGAGNVPRGGP